MIRFWLEKEQWKHYIHYLFTSFSKTLTTSASADMTLPRVVRDLLIFAPSLSRVPLAPVESARSLPAKSTKLTLLTWKIKKYFKQSIYIKSE